jgi:hypothetical protein
MQLFVLEDDIRRSSIHPRAVCFFKSLTDALLRWMISFFG